jgi:hypothetical protein
MISGLSNTSPSCLLLQVQDRAETPASASGKRRIRTLIQPTSRRASREGAGVKLFVDVDAAAAFGTRATIVGAGLLASAVTAAAFFLPGMRAPEEMPEVVARSGSLDELLPATR